MSLSLKQMETMFIEKFLERYKMTDRDIRKAFMRFDQNKNGMLDLDELTRAISSLLNGVDEQQVAKLVAKYDTSGDGNISIEEFQGFLVNRNALDDDAGANGKSGGGRNKGLSKEETMRAWRQDGGGPAVPALDLASERSSDAERRYNILGARCDEPAEEAEFDDDGYGHNGEEDDESEAQGDEYVDNYEVGSEVRSEMPSEFASSDLPAMERRAQVFLKNLVGYLLIRAKHKSLHKSLHNRMVMQNPQRMQSLAMEVLVSEFHERSRGDAGQLGKEDFRAMCMQFSANIAGAPLLRPEVSDFLFDLCSEEVVGRTGARREMVGAPAVMPLLFPAMDKEQQAASGRVGRGPMRHDGNGAITAPPATGGHSRGPSAEPVSSLAEGAQTAARLYCHPKSRTPLVTPKTFDPALVKRSSQRPREALQLDYVFGMKMDTHSNSPVYCVGGGTVSGAAPARPSSGGSLSSRRAAMGSREGVQARAAGKLVYASAAMGVVHNLGDNTQTFFQGHTDDISCVSVSPDGKTAVTGQVGKPCFMCVWDTGSDAPPRNGRNGLIAKLGEGFFERAVCSVALTFDAKVAVGVGSDDKHSLGVWVISTGALIATAQCQTGVPPQVRSMVITPAQQTTEFLSSENTGMCDVICTAGDHHLRFWSLQRPKGAGNPLGGAETGNLQFKAGRVTTKYQKTRGVKTPAVYTCSGFIAGPPGVNNSRTFDCAVGGDNGYCYLFRQAECVAHVAAIKGGVSSLAIAGSYVVVGGMRGVVKLLDGRTLEILTVAETTPNLENLQLGAGYGGRGSAQGRGRDMSSGAIDWSDLPRGAGDVMGLSVSKMTAKGDKGGGGYVSVVGASAYGCAIRVDLPVNPSSRTGVVGMDTTSGLRPASRAGSEVSRSSAGAGASSRPGFKAWSLFHVHTDTVWGLATDNSSAPPPTLGGLIGMVTTGDDRWLNLWGVSDDARVLKARIMLEAAGRSCCLDRGMAFVAAGLANGSVFLYEVEPRELANPSTVGGLRQCTFRKDSNEAISDVKFSPDTCMLAAASHDNFIYLYKCTASNTRVDLSPVHKLRGHSSYVTHVDWSVDSRLLQSTCGAYELLYWNVDTGAMLKSALFASSDMKFKSTTCPIGFGMMGIWREYSDGTDVNAVDVSRDRSLVVTADDFGQLKLFNYPCVVQKAPFRPGNGHSSHVMNTRFLGHDAMVATVGGVDKAVMLWALVDAPTATRTRNYNETLN